MAHPRCALRAFRRSGPVLRPSRSTGIRRVGAGRNANARRYMTLNVTGIEGVRSLAGMALEPSPWLEVSQERVDAFAAVTEDRQWIHVDPERAGAGPFGTTVAHGFLTVSLIPHLWHLTARVEGMGMAVNYGLDRVRFPAPLAVPSRIRGCFRIERLIEAKGSVQISLHVTIERESFAKPVCAADMLVRYYA